MKLQAQITVFAGPSSAQLGQKMLHVLGCRHLRQTDVRVSNHVDMVVVWRKNMCQMGNLAVMMGHGANPPRSGNYRQKRLQLECCFEFYFHVCRGEGRN